MLVELGEVAVFEIFFQLAFAELVLTARLGDKRQMGKLWRIKPQALGNEDLSRRVGEVFFCPNDMRDLEVMIVDDAG